MNIKITFQADSLDEIRDHIASIDRSLATIAMALDTSARRLILFEIDKDGNHKRLGGKMLLKVTETKKFAIKPVDAKGNLAQIDGAPVWAVTDEALAALVVAEDGLTVELAPKGPLGQLKLQVKADADLGEGVKEIYGELVVDLVAGDAVGIEIAPVVEEPLP